MDCLRVRGFTQDDAHIFCMPSQIEDEVVACVDFAENVLKTFGFDEFKVELSTWDPNDRAHYIGSDENWALAEGSLKRALERKGIAYKTIPGEAAFYGPKIDIKLVDVLGRLWQLSTVQFDFTLPARFELEYVGEDGERHQPVMVHRALFGSVERFFGVLIEHYAGAFPLWLAPVQVGLVPIAERHHAYAKKVEAELKAAGLRVEVDDRNEKMNGKIRDFANQKDALHPCLRRQGRGSKRRQRPHPRKRRPGIITTGRLHCEVQGTRGEPIDGTLAARPQIWRILYLMATQLAFDHPISVEEYLVDGLRARLRVCGWRYRGARFGRIRAFIYLQLFLIGSCFC
jgi:hypothetical protein